MEWHRQFWEEPQAKADFGYWVTAPDWSLEEIVALSLGVDPRFVSSDKFVHGTRGTTFSAAYFERLDLVQRHHAAGNLDDRTRTTKVIEWAEEYDFALPKELVDLVRQLEVRRAKKSEPPQQGLSAPAPAPSPHEAAGIQSIEPQPEKQSAGPAVATSEIELATGEDPDEIPLTSQAKRQLANLRALLAAMAISKYNYNPEIKSEVPEILANLLNKKGVQLSAD